jgi:hypothetical protein
MAQPRWRRVAENRSYTLDSTTHYWRIENLASHAVTQLSRDSFWGNQVEELLNAWRAEGSRITDEQFWGKLTVILVNARVEARKSPPKPVVPIVATRF